MRKRNKSNLTIARTTVRVLSNEQILNMHVEGGSSGHLGQLTRGKHYLQPTSLDNL